MTPPTRWCVSLWTLLLLCALLQTVRADCDSPTLSSIETTTTTIRLNNCTLSATNISENENEITTLTPGTIYEVYFNCTNCTKSVTTKPEAVQNLSVSAVGTTSMFVTWKKPDGKISVYKVNSTVKNSRQTQENINITDLKPGVQYQVNVTAVAEDNETEGAMESISRYTKPEVVRNLTVTGITTSSLFVNWIKPVGNSYFYRVYWTDGEMPSSMNVYDTFKDIPNLTSGVQYVINVTAVAGDGVTEGETVSASKYTRPGIIGNVQATSETSTISINWTSPDGQVLRYKVDWDNNSSFTDRTSITLFYMFPGTLYTINITAIAGDNKTKGEPYTFEKVTKPEKVTSLSVTGVSTSSVSLSWEKPYGNADHYKIQWSSKDNSLTNNYTQNTSYTINSLVPGVSYNITVTAVALKSVEGETVFINSFTRPAKPLDLTLTSRRTDFMAFTWTLPEGEIEHYIVNISNADLPYMNWTETKTRSANFSLLYPGRLYNLTVTAEAGKFSSTSDELSFATVPNPPGSLVISNRMNSSLMLEWTTPVKMEHASGIKYVFSYTDTNDSNETKNDESEGNARQLRLGGLKSGTLYNITIATIGPHDLQSMLISNSSFTLPNPVEIFGASPISTTSISVNWTEPLGAKSHYVYLVKTYNETGALLDSQSVKNTRVEVNGLQPGSKYIIKVTVKAADGAESISASTSCYTWPKTVTNLEGAYVNTTAIKLTWARQSDYKPSYVYAVKAFDGPLEIRNGSTEQESYTFFSLNPGTLYTFYVYTVIEGVLSTNNSTQIYTIPGQVSGVIAIGTTTSLTVSWNKAPGQVSSYSVCLSENHSQCHRNLGNDTTSTVFTSLTPGVHYCVVLVTRSGPVQSNNVTQCNATFPNPPGPITVAFETVNSINFTWERPENMGHDQYNFTVSSGAANNRTGNNWFLLENLKSGSPYSISVITIGVWGYTSTEVTAENYTKPYAVTELKQTEITTNSVTLVWEQRESKTSYSYEVHVADKPPAKVVNITGATVLDLRSGSNYSFTVTTLTADGTRAEPETVSYFTRPLRVKGLQAVTLNTTAINLTWKEPEEYKEEYRYFVQTTGCAIQNQTVAEKNSLVGGLTPGTNCTFCVSVKAADGIKGEEYCTSQYTKPETVEPSISSHGSNSSVQVSWTKPPGNIERYKVSLNSTTNMIYTEELNSSTYFILFPNLSAGTLYSVKLSTFSGPFGASSEYVTNATFPNPPGLIEILNKTTSAIEFRWEDAPLMSGGSFHYQLTYTPRQTGSDSTIPGTTTSHRFSSLLSGTSYNISVKSVGPMNFESESVHSSMVTTRPHSVGAVAAIPAETTIEVTWTKPDEYKSSYRYNVTWESPDGSISSNMTSTSPHVISDLIPGSQYKIRVTTETSDGTQGESERVNNCTDASPVTDLTCGGPNSPNAVLILSWERPSGQSSHFQVSVENNGQTNVLNASCCNHNVSQLHHYTEYNVNVKTESCGHPSSPVSRKCWTGITKPPIPANSSLLSLPIHVSHNKFTVQIDRELLNEANGKITHVGVMVASAVPGDSDLTGYLGKTHQEWRKKSAKAYLATVIETTPQSRSSNDHLLIEIGTEKTWMGYTNGALDPSGSYHYAIVMFTHLELKNNLVNGVDSLVSITDFDEVVILLRDPNIIPMAVGVTLGIFGILFIILMGFIIYWRRFSKKEAPDIQIGSLSDSVILLSPLSFSRAKVSAAVRVEDYEVYYRKQKADSNCGFAEEFEDLKPVGTSQAKTHALSLENKPKNRYNNVLPYDSSRVKLSIIHGSPYDDYINANYMPGYLSRKEFIAAQGPLPGTVDEFWRMIWEKNVQTLVMLTRCNEQGRVKCEQYWVPGTKHFEDITVTTTSEIPLDDWTIRDFDVKNVKTAEVRSIRHFHFTAWPDHGVPETTELLISFRHLVREHMNQYSRNSPTVVHCSAGVGRTGTFIAIDRLIFQIERENTVDVFGIVYDLRMHRPLMVQTEDQYVFLNQCALDVIRSRTGNNVDLIYQNTAALSIYENVEPKKGFPRNKY
ncbi:receptor-type tyrosine-protein phosphatase eta [Menidia menidia]